MDYFDVKTHDILEVHVTTKRKISTKHIRSLKFGDIGEGVTLQRVILQDTITSGCNLVGVSHLVHSKMCGSHDQNKNLTSHNALHRDTVDKSKILFGQRL